MLDAIFECTLNMINKDFENYPEHRAGFFKLLNAINSCCFSGMLFFFQSNYTDLRKIFQPSSRYPHHSLNWCWIVLSGDLSIP
jgi:hypothetical protein